MPEQQSSSSTNPLAAAQTESNIQQPSKQQRPPFLRRCSISDPRLDVISQFVKEEKSLNPFNRMFSGLFERGSNFSLASTDSAEHIGAGPPAPSSSPNNERDQRQKQSHFAKGNSAAELKVSGSRPTEIGGLRKSASSISALYGTSPPNAASHHFPAIPEAEDDKGLVMLTGPGSSLAKQLGQGATISSPPSTGTASPPKSGFLGLFGGGGFLSRPVMHSQEENYRIIMALDR